MHVTRLEKVGDAVMLTVPPTLLNLLGWEAGEAVGLSVYAGRLIVEPQRRPRYTCAELLAVSDYSVPQSPEDREWIDAPAVGHELL